MTPTPSNGPTDLAAADAGAVLLTGPYQRPPNSPNTLAITDAPPPATAVVLITDTSLAHRTLTLVTWLVGVLLLFLVCFAFTDDPRFGLCLAVLFGTLRDLVRSMK